MKIGVYCRVSGENQRENTSLENQKLNGIKFCEVNGYEYEVFSEVVSGGKLLNDRDRFSDLCDKILNKELDGIWLYHWDRGWRDDSIKILFIQLVKDSGCKVFVGSEEKNILSDEGNFEMGFFSLMSDYERRRIKSRLLNGRRNKWSEGKIHSGRILFGYERDENGNIKVNEKESVVVKDIFKIYLRKDVKSYKDVLSRINKKYGKQMNGKSLNFGLVSRSLNNDSYKGLMVIDDKKINKKWEFNVERIIEDEMYDLVKKKKGYVKGIRRGNTKTYSLLKGKIKCSDCGSKMWMVGSNNKNQKVDYRYYKCGSIIKKKRNKNIDGFYNEEKIIDCKSFNGNGIEKVDIENLVWDSLYQFLSDSDTIKKEYKNRFDGKKGSKNDIEGKIKYYEGELVKWDDKKRKLITMNIDDEDFENIYKDWVKNEYNIRVSEINGRIVDLKNELKRYDGSGVIEDYIELMKLDLMKEYELEDYESKRKKIEKYVNWVSIKNSGYEYDIEIKVYLGDNMEGNKLELEKRFNNVNVSILNNKYINNSNLIYKWLFEFKVVIKVNKIRGRSIVLLDRKYVFGDEIIVVE